MNSKAILFLVLVIQGCSQPAPPVEAALADPVQYEQLGVKPLYDSTSLHARRIRYSQGESVRINSSATPSTIKGPRLKISGDFNGDGLTEELTEHFVDSSQHETHKFIQSSEYSEQVKQIHNRDVNSFLLSSSSSVDTFWGRRQSFGLLYAENVGNLNYSLGDELLVVIDNADWSSMNTALLFSFEKGRWQRIAHWMISEMMVPNATVFINDQVWSFNPHQQRMSHEKEQPSLLKKTKRKGSIQVRTFAHGEIADSLIQLP